VSTAPARDQRRLLDAAAVDLRLRQLDHAQRILPEHAQIAELRALQAGDHDRRVAAATAVSDLRVRVAKAESDVEQVRARMTRDTERLAAGTGSSKDLIGLQHELNSLSKRQRDLEDIELELLEQLEQAEANLALADADTEAHDVELARLTAARDEQITVISAERDQVVAQREQIAVEIDSGLLQTYERSMRRTGGIGAAAFEQGRCGGCQLQVNPGDAAQIRAAGPDDVVHCEECGCILVRE
jgi:predicted  nucleic acid-binding Zn-ribbon protein